jgi:transcriptional regulator with GAF, ATPase, and Fis domain
MEKYSRNTGKKINSISTKAMQDLMNYSWPGNVRELEHLIERTILMTNGNTIKDVFLPTANTEAVKTLLKDDYVKTYEENERDHIMTVLEQCKGKIFGRGGAAQLLNLNVATLNSKIKKLGIEKEKPIFKVR